MTPGPHAKFWQAHAAGKIRDISTSTCMDPNARYSYGVRAHHGQVMAKNYKDKAAKEIKLVEPVQPTAA